MKEGWKIKKLGEVCDFISGFTPKKNELNSENGIPYYKVSDMNRVSNTLYLTETELYVKESKKIIPANSIVFPKNGGAIFTGKKRILAYNSIVDLNTEAIKIVNNDVSLAYLFQYLQFVDFGQFDNGGGLPSLNIKKMKEFSIPVPPLPDQQRIVSFLDASFAKIETLKSNAQKNLDNADQLWKAKLEKVFSNKDWKMKKLGEVCDKKQNIKWKHESNESYYYYIDLSSVNRDTNQIVETQKINTLNAPSRAQQIIKEGDVIFGTTRPTLKRVCIIPSQYDNQICSTGFCVLRANKNLVTPNWIYHNLLSDDFYKYIGPLQRGAMSFPKKR